MYGTRAALAGGGAVPVTGALIDLPAWILAVVTLTFAIGALVGLVRPAGAIKP
ncbi:hypothetical protein AB0M02_36770 [Actinoplanes sp. NPDC051861]|uniref:hypothetical protein n=1 Tax=Actinoplanes sp. NPDC051861 TaxID=3155170 RepID=UPI00343BFA01